MFAPINVLTALYLVRFVFAFVYRYIVQWAEITYTKITNARSGGDMGGLFVTFMLIIIGLALTPTIVASVGDVTGTGGDNLTGSSQALALLIPMFWVIIILAVGLADSTGHPPALAYRPIIK